MGAKDGMSDIVRLDGGQYRLLVALRYLNASEHIWKGMQTQRGVNDFYFLITLRSTGLPAAAVQPVRGEPSQVNE